ncbi:unnamed protein product, partial [Adineta ricciae]
MLKENASVYMESSVISVVTISMQNLESSGSSVKYFQLLLKRFGVMYMAIVITLGFIGNSISCYVFVR